MPFPMSLSGTVRVPGVAVETAAHGIERALADARAPVARTHDRIVFRRGAWKYGLSIVERVTGGVAEVTQTDDGVAVTYRVTLAHHVWIASGLVALLGLALVPQLGGWALPVLFSMWLWLVGMAYLDVALTWPSFLARAAALPGAVVARKRNPSTPRAEERTKPRPPTRQHRRLP